MVCIGGGAAGMITAAGTAYMGGRSLIIERSFMGGDCLNTGCVPSKTFLSIANKAHKLRTGKHFGLNIDGVKVDFAKVMERVRTVRAEIGEKDSPDNFSKEYDVDIILGEAIFKDKNTITVNGREIKFLKATICTGASPSVPDIKGLNTIPYMTSENVFNLTK
jgi:pyruvate/2-oxoglutarate dehydrogenase complex dihydrolipoamide dehydrogenase (E3) component